MRIAISERGWSRQWCCSPLRFWVRMLRYVWLVLPCACLAIAVLARRPILGLVATIATAMLIPFELGTGREVSLNLAALLIPATFALWLLIMVRHRDIHLPRSRTTPPLLLFILASLLSLVVGNAYWDPGVPRPGNILLVQLGQWGIFACSALAFWLMGSLGRNEVWLRRLTFFYLSVAGLLAIIRVMPGTARIRELIATIALDRGSLLVVAGCFGGWAVAFQPESLHALAMVSACDHGSCHSLRLYHRALDVVQSSRRGAGLGCAGVVSLAPLAMGLYPVGASGGDIFFPAFFDFAGGEAEWDESGGSRLRSSSRVVEVTMRNPITGLGPASYRVIRADEAVALPGSLLGRSPGQFAQ